MFVGMNGGGRETESGGTKTPTCPLFEQFDHDCSETRTMGAVLCRLLELLRVGGATSMRLRRKPLARLSEEATRALRETSKRDAARARAQPREGGAA